jgi:hypothetical protein
MTNEIGEADAFMDETLVQGTMSSETRWRDISTGAAANAQDGARPQKLGTVAVINHDQAQSTYAFNAFLTVAVDRDNASLTIASCSGHGTCLDGMDRGSVRFESRAPWTAAIVNEREFELSGEVVWSDRFNEQVAIPLRLTGLLRDDGGVDRLLTSFVAPASYDPSASEELLMEVPAVW